MKNFKELKIWKKGMEIIQVTYTIIDLMPKGLRYELGSQMIRSAISIPSNIAEGSSRTSSKDYNRFLEIALGSAFELETQVLIFKEINRDHDTGNLLSLIQEEQKMMMSFMKKITHG